MPLFIINPFYVRIILVAVVLPDDAIRRVDRPDLLQHLDLLVPDVLGPQAGGGLHGHQGQNLHEVVLHDIPDDAVAVEVPSAPHHPDGLLECDADIGDVVLMKQGAQLTICEAQGEQVEHQRFGEIMVYSECLGLAQMPAELVGELLGLCPILAKGLLHDDAASACLRPAVQLDSLHRTGKKEGWQREVEHPVILSATLGGLPYASVQRPQSGGV
mmetsp:Transcript_19025/g.51184  ORF Transcript_19025/g.51184 Transcript_19025/m.51184 type:complete len:215 (-) Transcript_19025:276-920(-)